MTRTHAPQGSRLGLIARRLAILALPAALVMGCGDSDENGVTAPTSTPTATRTFTPTPTRTPTPTATKIPNGSASAACEKLVGCDQCFINQTGQCIGTSACAQRLSADAAICINGVNGCNQNTLGDCLFPGCDGNDATGECE